MNRYPDRPRLIGDGARNCLPDPPRSIRTELITFAVIEFIDRAKKSYISLLNKIEKLHSFTHIMFRHTYDKPEVPLRKSFAGFLITFFSTDRKLALLFRTEQRNIAYFAQI